MILILFMLICVNPLVPGVHSVHPSPFLQEELNLQPNFQKGGGGLAGPELLGGCWEIGG